MACSTRKWRHGPKRSALRTSLEECNFTKITVTQTHILYSTVSFHVVHPSSELPLNHACAQSAMLSLFCSADWPSKSICKSVLNFRWTSLWRGGVGTAVYGRLCNDEGHLTKALSTLFGRLTTLSRQNGSLWKRYVLSSSCINLLKPTGYVMHHQV
jgi:hypothetical protein